MMTTLLRQGHFALQSHDHSESLNDLVTRSQNVLLIVSSIFPLDLFPDILTIDENKVTIIHNTFIGALHVHSILIEDITEVTVHTNPFFATLDITDSNNPRYPLKFSIRKLRKNEALLARKLVQGLVETARQNVSLAAETVPEITKKISTVGSVEGLDNNENFTK